MKDIEIYEILVREHEAMLQSYVTGLIRDPALVDDICQETFIRGFHALAALKDKGSFPAWIRTIARNLALVELKRHSPERPTDPLVMQGMEDVFVALDENVSGDTWQERVRAVRLCLERLPDTLQACCKMHYLDGTSTKGIAGVLGISLAAVLKRLERARVAIAKCVERRLRLEEV